MHLAGYVEVSKHLLGVLFYIKGTREIEPSLRHLFGIL